VILIIVLILVLTPAKRRQRALAEGTLTIVYSTEEVLRRVWPGIVGTIRSQRTSGVRGTSQERAYFEMRKLTLRCTSVQGDQVARRIIALGDCMPQLESAHLAEQVGAYTKYRAMHE
jgi:hypothetical protein